MLFFTQAALDVLKIISSLRLNGKFVVIDFPLKCIQTSLIDDNRRRKVQFSRVMSLFGLAKLRNPNTSRILSERFQQ